MHTCPLQLPFSILRTVQFQSPHRDNTSVSPAEQKGMNSIKNNKKTVFFQAWVAGGRGYRQSFVGWGGSNPSLYHRQSTPPVYTLYWGFVTRAATPQAIQTLILLYRKGEILPFIKRSLRKVTLLRRSEPLHNYNLL